jgi:hypothetical protein
MNNKRPAGGMYELQNSAKQKKINEPNREAICHGQKKKRPNLRFFNIAVIEFPVTEQSRSHCMQT